MKFELDKYSTKARLYPAFLVLLPAFILSIYYITDFEKYYHYFTALISTGLFTYLLSQLGRDKGKLKEPDLYKSWGGKPTSQILRHTNNYLDETTKRRYHKLLSQKIEEINIPTLKQEQDDIKNADEIYDSCSKYLISKTRDTTKYSLLFKENVSYGFRRNLWGMKVWAFSIIIFCFIIHFYFVTSGLKMFSKIDINSIIFYLFLFVWTLFWITIVTKKWIKLTAFAYAERLYETLNDLQ
jgi:hypothetical protein